MTTNKLMGAAGTAITQEQKEAILNALRTAHDGIEPTSFLATVHNEASRLGFTWNKSDDLEVYPDSFYFERKGLSFSSEVTVYVKFPRTEARELPGFYFTKAEVEISWSGTSRSVAETVLCLANYQAALQLAATIQAMTEGKTLAYIK